MHHVVVFEAANDVRDGIDLTNMPEELVPQPLASTCPLDQTGDVDKLHGRRQNPFGVHDRGQGVETRVGDIDDPNVRLNGAEGVVGRFGAGGGDGIEDGRLAHVGKTDDAAFEAHK